MKIRIFLFLVISFVLLGQTSVINAASEGIVPCGKGSGDPCTICDLARGMHNIIDTIVKKWIFPAAMIIIVVSGIMYIISSGNPGMISKAKTAMTGALIGIAITLSAFVIITFILNSVFTVKTSEVEGLSGIGANAWTVNFNCGS